MKRNQFKGSVGLGVAVVALVLVGLFCWWAIRNTDAAGRGQPSKTETAGASAAPVKPVETKPRNILSRLKPGGLPEIDQRSAAAPSRMLADREAGAAVLRGQVPGVRIGFDLITGAPSNITAVGSFLSKPQDVSATKNDPLKGVRRFVDENPALFGHPSSALEPGSSRITREDVTAHSGLTTVVWQQELDGIPLFNTIFKANLTKNGEVVTVGSHFLTDPAGASKMTAQQRSSLVAQSAIDAPGAISRAAASLNDEVPETTVVAQSEAEGLERKQRFAAPKLSDTTAKLTWMPMSADEVKLAWDVTTFSIARNEMFRTVVDATSGVVLYRVSLTNDISNASYRVYADSATLQPFDSPAPFSPGHSTPSSVQPPEVARQLVTTQAENVIASPNGWIDDGGTQTLGNNVDAHTDIDANNVADLPRPTSATRVFDFAMNTALEPTTYRDASVTHLFYLNNWVHDKLYALGFTPSAGNFQNNTFGLGGLGNDAVQADAQDGSGTNNANFSTPSDGSPGRMQMYIFPGAVPDRDGDFDDEIVIHEYCHGLSNRLVGGGVGMSALQSRGMGEGWSDFYGLCLLGQAGDDPEGQYAAGGYATYQLSGLTSNYYYGIRHYPYTTDMSKNPVTFKDIDPTQSSAHTGIPASPIFGSIASNPSEVHNQGEIWCATLWEVRRNLVVKHGFAVGNQLMLQLTTDGMKLSVVNPNMLQARDAIVQADLVATGGANQAEIWAGFAKRGMGASATSPASSSTTGVVEAYDIPDDLSVTPTTTVAAAGPVGGPFTPASQTYTLTNTGATTPLTWTAAAAQPWMTVSPAGGTLASGASTTVTMAFNSAAAALAGGSYSGTVNFTNTTSAVQVSRAVSLVAGSTDYFTELFDTTTNDTDNQSWLFTPNGSSSYYGVTKSFVTVFPTDPAGGTALSLSDDSFVQVTPAGVQVSLFGVNYSSFYVGSNGYVTFGSGDSDLGESLGTHFAKARIAALYDDLNPGSAGTVSWRQLADRIAVTFQSVPQFSATDSNNFQIEMYFDGRIRITCLVNAATDGLIGLSRGLGIPAGFIESDFSAYGAGGGTVLALQLTTPATATEGDGVLVGQGTVTLSAAQASDVIVTLASSNTGEATVPATVTVPATQLSATFDVTIGNDAFLDGPQAAIISATATAFTSAASVTTVQDNDGTGTLTLTAPASATEGAGTVTGTITTSVAPGAPMMVTLTSSDTTEAQVPASVVIPEGQTSINFPITIVNDTAIDGAQSATLTVSVVGWTNGTAPINVLDNENINLALSLPATITEGGTGTGTVSISGTLPSPLTVSLSSNTTSRLTVPVSATIAAGSTSATFSLTTVNNTLTDGSALVGIGATAGGFTSANGTTTVLDNDLHHYNLSAVAATQTRGVPFSVTVTAKDVNDVTIASYTTPAALSATGTGGPDSITPTTTTAFTAGVWTGNVMVNTFDTNVVLTASDGAGHTGASNAFNVVTGALHHFAWNAQAVRAQGAPVSATITAQDLGNNTVTSFAGTASLSGYVSNPAGSSIVITEVNPNTPDEIEFMNVGAGSVDISGWKVYIYDNISGNATPLTVFTIPAGTTCVAGQVFRLQEGGATPGALPLFFYGANIDWTSGGGSQTAVLLRNSSGGIVDFAAANASSPATITSPQTIPASQWSGAQIAVPAVSTHGYLRIGSADGNTAADWTTSTPSIGTANTGLTTPFPSSQFQVFLSPTVSGAFSGGLWTGNMTVQQTAGQMRFRADDGASHAGDSNPFDVTGTLGLSVPSSAPEGSAPVTGSVSVSVAPAGNLTVTLTSSDTTAATVPATATILSGQTSATFPITIVDDAVIDGTQFSTITAHVTNWADATSSINVLDDETLSLSLFLPGSVTEGSTATATVSASGAVVSPLTVSLVSNNTARLAVPATVIIPGGSSSITFNLTAVENALTDGTAVANVTASAAGYIGTNENTDVLDNDVHHFAVSTVTTPQTKGVPFNVVITAQDVSGNTLAGYGGTPALTASGAGGANVISPATASGFVSGIWTGQITAFITDTNVVITVSAGAGLTGTSNAFDVVNPTSATAVVESVSPATVLSGNNPRGQLVIGADGSFYGTTQLGGGSNQGAVFKVTPAGVMTTLVNFHGANGAQPFAGLVLGSDGNFYGTTSAGGGNNLGTIFKMTPSGVLTTLVHLTSSTGTSPRAPLLLASDGNFYGTTSANGGGSGTVFKMTPAGVITVLTFFTGSSGSLLGSSCQAALIQASDGNLYGVTSTGGSGGGFGTVFKVTTGGAFTTLVNFTGATGARLGSSPLAALTQASDGNLYGTTSLGGTGGFGTVFKVTTAGVFTNLLSFTNNTGLNLGNGPLAALRQWTDGNLYGTTNTGGTSGVGTIFRVTTAGVLTTLRSLSSTADGANPNGAMVLAGDDLFYGVAASGGNLQKGTVFSISPTTSAFTRVFSFVTSPPVYKNLLQAGDGNFYGAATFGSNGGSTVFKLTPGGILSTLTTFSVSTSVAPSLIEGSDGNLYGTGPIESGFGTVFALTTSGTKTTLATFTNTSGLVPGNGPRGGITQGSDGLLYGTTQSGGTGGGFGTVFKVTTGGAVTSLASFTNTTGAVVGNSPQTRLAQGADGNLYGTTQSGGAGGFGTVFKVTPGGALTTLVAFTGTTGAYLGSTPNTNLLLASDGNFYGTTTGGGTAGFGTIYKIAADGTFTSLLSFTGTSGANLGQTPSTNLIQGSDGNFYGTTNFGGTGGSNGTVFKVTPAGVLTTLVSFTGTTGAAQGSLPHGTLIQGSDGYFYGASTSGGLYNLGTVFRVSSTGVFQSLYTFGVSNDGGSPNISGSTLYPDSYRLIAGADGYLYGVNASSVFRVHQQPAIQSVAVTGITSTGATLNGSVIPNQDAATAYYQYGFTTSYGSQTTTQNLAAGTTPVPVDATLSGLLPGVVYHFRLVTVTAQGTFVAADQTFATPSKPLVITGSFTNAGQTGFALDGVVNPLGTSTSYYFEYGTTTAYGTQTAVQSAGGGIANVPVGTTVNSLLAGTTYHVRLVATSSYGTTNGDDQVITTFPVSTSTIQPMSQYLSTGISPLAGLFKGSDGYFYGTLSSGGTFGSAGAVFRMSEGGTLTTLANFYNNTNATLSGNNPQSSLVQGADGNFYGTTNSGGAIGQGCVFKVTPAGQVTILVSFSNTGIPLGSNPICGLTAGTDGNFYGVTQNGGSSFLGTIFKVTPAGVLTTLVNFTGTTGSFLGSSPRSALTLGADGNFYGTTATGGAGGFGTIFKVTPAGVLTTMVQFTGTAGAYPGSTPIGALALGADGNFYGTTSLGGVNNLGTVFKVTPAASFVSLATFSGTAGATLGTGPKGALAQMPDGNFYGTTQTGGLSNVGTVFAITPAGALTTLVSLTGSTGAALGATPQGALVAGTDGALYGATNGGGLNNVGTIFKVTTSGLFTTLVNLTASPNIGRLIEGVDGKLYGATFGGGGSNGYGTLFAAPVGGAPATLSTLLPTNGTTPLNARAGLLLGSDGNYYGTTAAGGTGNVGTVFKLTPAGVYTTLISFTGTAGTNPGSSPQAALILGADGNYYGTTSGGGSGLSGTIFKMTPAGVQTTLVSFTGNTGANPGASPQGPLTLGSDGNYYGTTLTGGTGGIGTIFKMSPAGVMANMANFTGTSGAVLGTNPSGVLAQAADGNFYGTTQSGGASGLGTVFKITPAGVFTSLASFTGSTGALLGQIPMGGLFAGLDGCFYGVTLNGGAYFQGALFRVAPDDSVTSLYSFSGRGEGMAPNNGLVRATDGYLYGGDATAIYRLNPPPVLLAAPATIIAENSATLNGSITGESYSGTVNFEHGLTTAYGSTTPDVIFDPGTAATVVSAPVAALQPFLTYHFRLKAVTSSGDFYSQDRTFATPNTATFNAATDVPVTADGFSAAGLPLNVALGFGPANGTVLMLVNNIGFSPIFGTFSGLPNGSVVSSTFGAQTYFFVVNYSGGDGNDITLTAVSQAINFPAISNKQTTDAPFALAATATSGLAVSYTIVAGNSSATLAGSTVTLTGTAGVVTIKATQPGDGGSIGPAIPVYQTFVVFAASPFVQIVSSKVNDFTLGIRADGTLWGWGSNGNGQLANSFLGATRVPAQIGSVTTWQSVSAGGSHTVAVRTDGTLWAWGLNTNGQLGDGTTTQRTAPVQIAGTTWSVAVAGNNHTVAVKSDGTIWAWGANGNGQLGLGTTDLIAHSTPTQIGALTTWAQTTASLTAGTDFTLALKTDGTLWGWGLNTSGQLGDASFTTRSAPVQVGAVATWNSIAAGTAFSIGTRSDGTIWTWGVNSSGQLGDGTTIFRSSPVQFTALSNVQTIGPGGNHVLAVKTDGTLWAWGSNNPSGQLGQNTADTTAHPVPAQIGTATTWQLMAPGFNHSVATRTDGTVWSWGSNDDAQLGYGPRLPLPASAQLGPVALAAAGNYHSLVIKPDGTLWVWGNNFYGQMALGSTDNIPRPAPIQISPGSTWLTAATGGYHNIAIRSDGTLWTWGYNFYGQIGDGTTTSRSTLFQIGTDNTWVKVAAGIYFSIALKADGTLWAWGYNVEGQLGDGTNVNRTTPVQVGTAADWASISAAFYHVLAKKTDGTLWTWGYNSSGQLGNGTTTNRNVPAQLGAATDWAVVAGGGHSSFTIKTNGTMWSWGLNTSSQLGDGSVTNRTTPVQIGVATNWRSVTGNFGYGALATRTDGTLWSWGSSAQGGLGNGSPTSSTLATPTQVGTSTAWSTVGLNANSQFSQAITSDGTLWNFGASHFAQLSHGGRNLFVPDLVLPALSPAQTIAFPAIGDVPVGTTATLAATTGSGLPASYFVSGPATLVGDEITVTGPGLISAIAYQAGDNYWQSSDIAQQFINASPATITGLSATGVTTTSATLNATINPNGTPTATAFQSGATIAYGTDTPIALTPNNGLVDQSVDTSLTGLTPGATYHFRVTATNAAGLVNSTDVAFTTVSNNANLASLAMNPGTLSPAFASGTTSYVGGVLPGAGSVTVTPATQNANATVQVRVNGGPYTLVPSASASGPLALNPAPAATPVDLLVTAQDGTTKTYAISVLAQTSSPVSSTLGDVVTGGGAPDANGADSGLDFDVLQRGGYLAENGMLAFPGELTGPGVDATNFKGFWKHDGAALKRIARTGDDAPQTGSPAAKFSDLPLIPGINDDGQITLLAALGTSGGSAPPTTSDNDVGLWSELGGTGLNILMREGDIIPSLDLPTNSRLGRFGSGCFATAKLPDSPPGTGRGEAAFTVTLKDGATDTALLRASITGPAVTTVAVVARENTAAPGVVGESFANLNGDYTGSVRMDAQGNLCFGAILKPSAKTSLWYQPKAGGAPVKVFVAGDAAPDALGATPVGSATFRSFDIPSMGGGGTIAIRGVLNQDGDNADNSRNDGIWRGDTTDGFVNILRRGDTNASRPGLNLPSVNAKAGNIFSGWLTNGNHGAWLGWVDLAGDGISPFPADTFGIYTDLSGVMSLLIKSGDPAPGLAGADLFFIDHPVVSGDTLNEREYLAFVGTVTGTGITAGVNDKGVWRSTNGEPPILMLRIGDAITTNPGGLKIIADVDFPGSNLPDHQWETPVMDANGRLLVFVTFTDGTTCQVIVP